MSEKEKVRLVFACGAYLLCHADDAQAEGAIGTKALVFVNDPKVSNQRPHIPEEAIIAEKLPPDARACCLLMCPAKARESGRKVARGWFSASPDCPTDSAPVLYVTCKIKAHSPNAAAVGRRGSDVPTSGLLADESKGGKA